MVSRATPGSIRVIVLILVGWHVWCWVKDVAGVSRLSLCPRYCYLQCGWSLGGRQQTDALNPKP